MSKMQKLIFTFILFITPLLSAPPVILQDTIGKYPLGLHLDFLRDIKGRWNIHEVKSIKFNNKWVASQSEVPNFGYDTNYSVYWIRISLENKCSSFEKWLLEFQEIPWMDRIDFYLFKPDGTFVHKVTGDTLPFHNRDIAYHNFVFRLSTFPKEKYQLYLRFENQGGAKIPIVLYSVTSFSEKISKEIYIWGLFFGILLLALFYNLFIFLSIRDRSYFYYILYVFSFILHQMSDLGLAYQYFWPNSPWWANQSYSFFGGFGIFSVVLFTQSFLHTKQNIPILHKILFIFIISGIVLMGISPFVDVSLAFTMFMLLTPFTIIVILLTGIISWFQGNQSAGFFLLAWIILLCGVSLLFLKTFAILPSIFLTEYGIKIGAALEVILLSFALANRINIMKKEKMYAQQESLELQRILNEELEYKVEKRTEELNKTLGDLEHKHNLLKRANTKIMDSIQYAKLIQDSILPNKEEIKTYFPEHFIYWEPKDVVGGDFYQFYVLKEGLLLMVGDCTGHGVPGGFMTMLSTASLRNIILGEKHTTTGTILSQMNNSIKKSLKQESRKSISDDGLDCGICLIKPGEQKLEYSGAKSYLFTLINGELAETKGNRKSIGYTRSPMNYEFTTHSISIPLGTTFYMFTDGLIDQIGGDFGYPYGKKRLIQLLVEIQDKPMKIQKEFIIQSLKEYQGNQDRLDDVTIIGIRILR